MDLAHGQGSYLLVVLVKGVLSVWFERPELRRRLNVMFFCSNGMLGTNGISSHFAVSNCEWRDPDRRKNITFKRRRSSESRGCNVRLRSRAPAKRRASDLAGQIIQNPI
jgi:hypothetical protein